MLASCRAGTLEYGPVALIRGNRQSMDPSGVANMGARRYTTEHGLTLIELLAVIAIVGILAAVIIPSVSRFGEDSFEAQALQDLHTTNGEITGYTAAREGGETIDREPVALLPTINGDPTEGVQVVSSKWPEVFLTLASSTPSGQEKDKGKDKKPPDEGVGPLGPRGLYGDEFPVVGDTDVTDVCILDSSGNPIPGSVWLAEYTAVDFETLDEEGYLIAVPESAAILSADGFHSYLWTMKKTSSSADAASRSVTVFKLVRVDKTKTGDSTSFVLNYVDIS